MSPQYPIMDIHADWKTEPEQMGSKQRFWYRQPEEVKKPEVGCVGAGVRVARLTTINHVMAGNHPLNG